MWRCHSAAAGSSRSSRSGWAGMAWSAIVVEPLMPHPVPEFAGRQFPGPRWETLCLIETFVLSLVRTATVTRSLLQMDPQLISASVERTCLLPVFNESDFGAGQN